MLIDGKELAARILDDLALRVANLQKEKDIIPHLGVIVVGNDPATASYVRQKERMGKVVGAEVSTYRYPIEVPEKEVMDSIAFLQEKGNLHGLIIQLPLPAQLSEEALTMAVVANKDVDGFRPDSDFVMPIAAAVIELLKEVHKWETGKGSLDDTRKLFETWLASQTIVIMGKGKTGGQPIIHIMKKLGITPIIVDSKTANREEVLRTADILICAVGNKGTIVTEDMIKKDAILIGIGMSLGADGKLHGDYNPEEIKDKAAYFTPIPGGVGPVNAAMLLVNIVDAAEQASKN